MKNQQAAEALKNFLKNGKHRITPERFEVLDAALDYHGHFGADELYVTMKNRKASVSRATVYNTLELLVQCNLVGKRNFGDNMTHYESNLKKQKHDHLICVDCGRIVEFINPEINALPDEICSEMGFQVESYSFNIFARCNNTKACKHYKNKT